MPLMSSPLRVTTSGGPAAATPTPLVPAASTPATVPTALIVIDLVIVIAPKPPGSSTSISPATAVLEIAPANVLQGAVRLHGLTSSPTPETQVRVAWAEADAGTIRASASGSRAGASRPVRRLLGLWWKRIGTTLLRAPGVMQSWASAFTPSPLRFLPEPTHLLAPRVRGVARSASAAGGGRVEPADPAGALPPCAADGRDMGPAC